MGGSPLGGAPDAGAPLGGAPDGLPVGGSPLGGAPDEGFPDGLPLTGATGIPVGANGIGSPSLPPKVNPNILNAEALPINKKMQMNLTILIRAKPTNLIHIEILKSLLYSHESRKLNLIVNCPF